MVLPTHKKECKSASLPITAWKVSKYGVFSGPNTGKYGPEKIWTLFTHCIGQLAFYRISLKFMKCILISINFFVKHQCGFGKGYNVQHRLLVMIEKMKEARDKNKICAAVLTDLSKAFDFLRHDLLILKPYIWLVLLQ